MMAGKRVLLPRNATARLTETCPLPCAAQGAMVTEVVAYPPGGGARGGGTGPSRQRFLGDLPQ